MGHVQRLTRITVDEYLAGELTAPTRNEFVAGQIYAMVGASKAHNRLCQSIAVAFDRRIRPPRQIFVINVKVRVEAADAYYYPDVVVSCDRRDTDPDVVHFPRLVVEVLSPSTAQTDRREKLPNYRTVPGLTAVLLVHQDARRVEVFRHDGEGWVVERVEDEGSVVLPDLDEPVPLVEIYAGVDPTMVG